VLCKLDSKKFSLSDYAHLNYVKMSFSNFYPKMPLNWYFSKISLVLFHGNSCFAMEVEENTFGTSQYKNKLRLIYERSAPETSTRKEMASQFASDFLATYFGKWPQPSEPWIKLCLAQSTQHSMINVHFKKKPAHTNNTTKQRKNSHSTTTVQVMPASQRFAKKLVKLDQFYGHPA